MIKRLSTPPTFSLLFPLPCTLPVLVGGGGTKDTGLPDEAVSDLALIKGTVLSTVEAVDAGYTASEPDDTVKTVVSELS